MHSDVGMSEPKEPQSYGSEKDWLTGNTSQEVNRQKGHPNSQRGDFFTEDQGGKVSPKQSEENDQHRSK